MYTATIGQQTAFPRTTQQALLPPSQNETIKRIAINTILELALFLTVGVTISFFVSPIGTGYLASCIALRCAMSFILRCMEEAVSPVFREKKIFFGTLRAFNFSRIGTQASTLIHEGGHALSTFLVYQNPKPRIEIVPGIGGNTSFSVDKLTNFGKAIGRNRSLALVTAAGASLSLLASSILFWLGLKLRKTKQEISAYLIIYAVTDFMTHACYALSALWTRRDVVAHDFVRLYALTGVHPLLVAVVIAAIPAWIAYRSFRNCSSERISI